MSLPREGVKESDREGGTFQEGLGKGTGIRQARPGQVSQVDGL